jgi:hypothetical protein
MEAATTRSARGCLVPREGPPREGRLVLRFGPTDRWQPSSLVLTGRRAPGTGPGGQPLGQRRESPFFPLLKPRSRSEGAGRSLLHETAGTAKSATRRASYRETGRGRSPRAVRTPNRSARSGRLRPPRATEAIGNPRSPQPQAWPAKSRPNPRRWHRPRHRREGSLKLIDELRKLHVQHPLFPDHDDRHISRREAASRPIRRPKPTPDSIAIDRAAELAAHGKTHSPHLTRLRPQQHARGSIDSFAALEERLKLGAVGQPLAARKSARQTVRRLRPFARRRLSVFRPPFVFMRSRKPWVFFRRR